MPPLMLAGSCPFAHGCRAVADPDAYCRSPAATCGLNTCPSSLLLQTVRFAPAGIDRGVGLCVSASQPNTSFLTLGGAWPSGDVASLQYATTQLQPGPSNSTNAGFYGYWVRLDGVSLGGEPNASSATQVLHLPYQW